MTMKSKVPVDYVVQTTPALETLEVRKGKYGDVELPDVTVDAGIFGPVTIPGDWLAMCTLYRDYFSRDYIGYWACGVARDDKRGWLVREEKDEDADAKTLEAADKKALACWRADKPLPEGYHRLDRQAAARAYIAMCSSGRPDGGIGWYGTGRDDANTYDIALQLGLLGEVVYG